MAGDDLEISDDLLRRVHQSKASKLKHPYAFDLIKVLNRHSQIKKVIVLDWIYKSHKVLGLPTPTTMDASILKTLKYFCINSAEFKARRVPNSNALFQMLDPMRPGTWSLIRENAIEWLKEHRSLAADLVAAQPSHE